MAKKSLSNGTNFLLFLTLFQFHFSTLSVFVVNGFHVKTSFTTSSFSRTIRQTSSLATTPLISSNNKYHTSCLSSQLHATSLTGNKDAESDAKNQTNIEKNPTSKILSEPSNPSVSSSSSSLKANKKIQKKEEKKKMELTWCTRETGCVVDKIRESVEGPYNHIYFQGPATGQVTYHWETPIPELEKTTAAPKKKQKTPSVLMLIKRDDKELLNVAAEAVRALTCADDDAVEKEEEDDELCTIIKDEVDVLLFPEAAAKLKYYHGVDDDHIKLFEPQLVPGFGCDKYDLECFDASAINDFADIERDNSNPDLICTLGGDGLLMYASSLFPGPVPPILCVAGGSLGFLTPFARNEMVVAIRHALGLVTAQDNPDDDDDDDDDNVVDISPNDTNQEQTFFNGLAVSGNYIPINKKFSLSPFGICLSMRMRLDCRVINREGVVRARYNVLNEVVIDRGSSPFLSNLECFCDNVHLTTVQADGIIFST